MFIKKILYAGRLIVLLCAIDLSLTSQRIGAENNNNPLHTGSNVSNQFITGTARVVTASNQLSKVCKGDIVITSMTDASWEPVLCVVAGIITDQGNDNSHAALFGKKMGIPVIVGAGNAAMNIVDGQQVTIDCSKSSFYIDLTADNEVAISPYYEKTRQPAVQSISGGHSDQSSYSYPSVPPSHFSSQKSRFAITKEKIWQDQPDIVKYIIYNVGSGIGKAVHTPKWLAYSWAGIEEDVYDSMPVSFFKKFSTASQLNAEFNQSPFDDEALQYIHEIQEDIEKFRDRKKPLHLNTLGRFLYRKLVDSLSIPENYKQILKKTPLKMNEFIRNNIVKMEEYLYFNKLNLAGQYYLKKRGIIE